MKFYEHYSKITEIRRFFAVDTTNTIVRSVVYMASIDQTSISIINYGTSFEDWQDEAFEITVMGFQKEYVKAFESEVKLFQNLADRSHKIYRIRLR